MNKVKLNWVIQQLENFQNEDSWEVTCDYLRKYHQRDDVLESDTLTKFVEGEYFDDEDEFLMLEAQYPDKTNAKLDLELINVGLYVEALERFKQVYAKEIALVVSIIQFENLLSGTVYQTFDDAYAIACAFVKRHDPEMPWGQDVGGDFDETVIKFAKSSIENGIPTDDDYRSY
jgi:hypothetical protein